MFARAAGFGPVAALLFAGACGDSTTVNKVEATGGESGGAQAEGGSSGDAATGGATTGGATTGGATTGGAATGGATSGGEQSAGGDGGGVANGGANGGESTSLPDVCPVPFPAGEVDSPLIDDFEDDPNAEVPHVAGRTGFWYMWNDGTGTLTLPDPNEDSQVAAELGVGADASAGMHVVGSGFDDWGAVLEVILTEHAEQQCPYDASAHDGVRFWIQGEPDTVTVYVTMPDMIPVEWGGLCTLGEEACDTQYYVDVNVPSGGGYVNVDWTDLEQDPGAIAIPFDPARIVSIEWEVNEEAGSFDFVVDNVSFF